MNKAELKTIPLSIANMNNLYRLGPLHVKRLITYFVRRDSEKQRASGRGSQEAIEFTVCSISALTRWLTGKHLGCVKLGTIPNHKPYLTVSGFIYVRSERLLFYMTNVRPYVERRTLSRDESTVKTSEVSPSHANKTLISRALFCSHF